MHGMVQYTVLYVVQASTLILKYYLTRYLELVFQITTVQTTVCTCIPTYVGRASVQVFETTTTGNEDR